MQATDLVVIGGGIAGTSAAYRAARSGASVTLVDRGDIGQATAAGAGIIAPGTSLRPLPAFFPLAKQAVLSYPELVNQLAEDGAGATGYEVVGAIHIMRDDAEAAGLEDNLRLFRERQADGMPNMGDVHEISPSEAIERFPALAAPRAAIWIGGAARVDGRLLRDALRCGAERRGARIVMGQAMPIVEGDQVTGVRVLGETIRTDAVVLAPGAWAVEIGDALGVGIPVAPQRGQIFHLRMPGTDTSGWPIIEGSFDHYLLTFGPDRVVAGATRETGSGFDPRLTAGGVHHALGNALSIAPGLAKATFFEPRVGLRPATPDGLPILGRVPGVDNAFLATGFGPSGLQLGPFAGALAADLALDLPGPDGFDLAPYALDRFGA
jgi:D-amino-acid dehydrogenase